MPVAVDELRTVMSVLGAQRYMGAMASAARATTYLERVTVHANKNMADSADAYYDKQANRWRDRESGQFLGSMSMFANPVAALAMVAAAELALLVGALKLAQVAFKQVTEAGREFEATMKDVEIQSGTSRAEMVKVKDAALAPELQKLGVAGDEAALAYKRLASEGYNAADMQAAMLPIVQTAVASGADQAEMTKVMLAIMRQYKLTIRDLPALGDAMTAALNKTTFQMEDLMGAMKYAGPIAGSLGWSFGETVAMLNVLYGQMGNYEMTGTGFRGFLNALLTPSAQMTQAFAEAGLQLSDYRKVMGDAGATLNWLKQGHWDTSLIMRAWGAEAGNAAAILLGTSVPAMQAVTDQINTTGNVARDAANKMDTLDGATQQAAAAFKNAKIWLYQLTAGLTTDFVQGVGLALNALTEYLSKSREQMAQTDGKLTESRDYVLEFAEAFVTGAAMVARGAIQVSRVIAFQAAGIANLAQYYQLLAIGILEASYAWAWWTGNGAGMESLSRRMDAVKAGIANVGKFQKTMLDWSVGGVASGMIGEVDKLEEQMLAKVRELREKSLAEQKKMAESAGTPLPKKGGMGGQQQDTTGQLEAAEDALKMDLKRLAVWEKMQKAKVRTPVEEAAIELAAKEKELALYQEMERSVYRMSTDQQKRAEATLARQEAEASYAEAQKGYAKDAALLNEQERNKTAADMERLTQRHKELNQAVQMVIGGSLSELARGQLARLSGVGDAKGWLQGVRANNNRTITLLLKPGGDLTEGQMNQVVNTLIPAIKQAGTRPAFGS